MEASQHNDLQIIQSYVQGTSTEVSPSKTVKMEDVTSGVASSQSLLEVPVAGSTSKAADSKPVKKRKSWGQVLPEPKTNLAPRKRAKTADEKEQRRIERVKRNRQAAHNSRERKRQEVEALQHRTDLLEAHMKLMQQQLDAYKAQFPNAKVPHVPELNLQPLPPMTAFATTPSSSNVSSQFIAEMATPAPFSSPDSLMTTIDSPADTAPSTPGNPLMEDPDRTQQSAVSVGIFGQFNLGGDDNHGKSFGAQLSNPIYFTEHDDTNFDFALYPSSSNDFFNESFDGSANHDSLFGDSSDVLAPF